MDRIVGIYYSPAGTTKSVVEYMAETLAEIFGVKAELFSYTLPAGRDRTFTFTENDLVIWGTSVNAGRIPNKTLEYVKGAFLGNATPAIPIVTFGNRSFGDSLAEMAGILKARGFKPIGAAAVVSRHVFSSVIAPGRPNAEDFAAIKAFCEKVANADAVPAIPGEETPAKYYTPLKSDGQPAVFLKARPELLATACTGCGKCAGLCPMGSIRMISSGDAKKLPSFDGICVKCHACILECPASAISINDSDFLSHVRMLEENYATPADSVFFL